MDEPPVSSSSVKITQQQYERVSGLLLPKLANELPANLAYHNAGHIKDVIRDAGYLIGKEGVPEEDRWMILTAALFHDSGFLRGYKNHEELSCDIAREILPSFAYRQEAIDVICRMIMATKLPQTPLDRFAMILCDADLFYLGTGNFYATAETLFKELQILGFIKNEKEWMVKQLRFLQRHHYFTKTAIAELEPVKTAHVDALKQVQKSMQKK